MKSDIVSVIVPVYNRENRIRRCLDSIINQTFDNIEIIIIDDASTDNTVNVIYEYIKNDYRIKLLTLNENGGVGKARNEGINYFLKSDSEYVIFVDSDDFIHPNYIKILYSVAKNKKADIVSCDRFLNNLNNNDFYDTPDNYKITEFYGEDGFINDQKLLLYRIINKKCFIEQKTKKICLCDELRCGEDLSILYKLYINASKTAHISLKLYYHCYDGTHITAGGFYNESEYIKMIQSSLKIIDTLDSQLYPKIFKYYLELFSWLLYTTLTKQNLKLYYAIFNAVFNTIKNYKLDKKIIADIKKNEKTSLDLLKSDFLFIYNNDKPKIKSLLYYVKKYILIKSHSRKFKKILKNH